MAETIENPPIGYSLTPYTGTWTKAEAAHLLRRALFGPTLQQINDAVSNGMNATVTSLLQIPAIAEPLAYDPAETIAPFGSSWVNAVYPPDQVQAQAVDTARAKSLGAWMMRRINHEQLSIAEKMCLFWQNHFAAVLSFDQRSSYNYFALIRQHALGDFKQLIKDMTINTNMLEFLNGGSNTLYSPNENYAREVLELFTIGKGPQIGEGDYSNYTEEDVAAGAKIFTGYIIDGLRSNTAPTPQAVFVPLLHDNSSKQLSYHFDGVSVPNAGANEYANYIDIIFAEDEVANHICRKIYRYFVNYDLTTDVETNVIPDMAQTLISNSYNILPVMDQLLKSEHFYDVGLRGSILRGPLDMLFSMFNSTQTQLNYDLATDSDMYLYLYAFGENLGQAYGSPPAVAGWPAYYQAPSYTKLWVNATHLKTRFGIAYYFTLFTGIPVNGENLKLQVLPFLNNLSNPYDADAVIDDICDVFFPKPISAGQKIVLKSLLLGGQPDFEWTIQYNEYLADSGNPTFYLPVQQKVELVLWQVFQMPEFHTM